MCKIKYFICDPVSVTKNCDIFKQKKKINVHITIVNFGYINNSCIMDRIVIKTFFVVKNKFKHT